MSQSRQLRENSPQNQEDIKSFLSIDQPNNSYQGLKKSESKDGNAYQVPSLNEMEHVFGSTSMRDGAHNRQMLFTFSNSEAMQPKIVVDTSPIIDVSVHSDKKPQPNNNSSKSKHGQQHLQQTQEKENDKPQEVPARPLQQNTINISLGKSLSPPPINSVLRNNLLLYSQSQSPTPQLYYSRLHHQLFQKMAQQVKLNWPRFFFINRFVLFFKHCLASQRFSFISKKQINLINDLSVSWSSFTNLLNKRKLTRQNKVKLKISSNTMLSTADKQSKINVQIDDQYFKANRYKGWLYERDEKTLWLNKLKKKALIYLKMLHNTQFYRTSTKQLILLNTAIRKVITVIYQNINESQYVLLIFWQVYIFLLILVNIFYLPYKLVFTGLARMQDDDYSSGGLFVLLIITVLSFSIETIFYCQSTILQRKKLCLLEYKSSFGFIINILTVLFGIVFLLYIADIRRLDLDQESQKTNIICIIYLVLILFGIINKQGLFQRIFIHIQRNQLAFCFLQMIQLFHWTVLVCHILTCIYSFTYNENSLQEDPITQYFYYFRHIFASMVMLRSSFEEARDTAISKNILDISISLFSGSFFCLLTAAFHSIWAAIPSHSSECVSAIQSLNSFCQYYQVPFSLRSQALQFYQQSLFQKSHMPLNSMHCISQPSFEKAKKLHQLIQPQSQQQPLSQQQQILCLKTLPLALQAQFMQAAYMQTINKIPLFKKYFSSDFKKQLSLLVHEKVFQPGQNIFALEHEETADKLKRGQPPPFIYLIISGQIELLVDMGSKMQAPFYGFGRDTLCTGPISAEMKAKLRSFSAGETISEIEFLTENRVPGLIAESTGSSCVHYIRFQDFINLLQRFPEDRESYCFLKDSIVIYKDYSVVEQKCLACQSSVHTLFECPRIFYERRKRLILNKYSRQIFLSMQLSRNPARGKKSSLKLYQKINSRTKFFIEQHKETIYSQSEENNSLNNKNRGKEKEFSILTNSYRTDQDFISPSLIQAGAANNIEQSGNLSRVLPVMGDENQDINSQTTILNQQTSILTIGNNGGGPGPAVTAVNMNGPIPIQQGQQSTPKGASQFLPGSLRTLRTNTNEQIQNLGNNQNAVAVVVQQQQQQQLQEQQQQQQVNQSSQMLESSEISEKEDDIVIRNKNISKVSDPNNYMQHSSSSNNNASQNNINNNNQNSSFQNCTINTANSPIAIQPSEVKELPQHSALFYEIQQSKFGSMNNLSQKETPPTANEQANQIQPMQSFHKRAATTKKPSEDEEQLSPSYIIRHQGTQATEGRRKESLLNIMSKPQSPTKIPGTPASRRKSLQQQQQQAQQQQQQQQQQREDLKSKHTMSSYPSERSEFKLSERVINNNSSHQFGLSASSFNRFEEIQVQPSFFSGMNAGGQGKSNENNNNITDNSKDVDFTGSYGIRNYKIYFPHNNVDNLLKIKGKPSTAILSFK